MTSEDMSDFTLGLPLMAALAEFHQSRAKGKYARCTLYQNKQSGGTVLTTREHGDPAGADLQHLHLRQWCTLTTYDLPTVRYLLADDIALAALTDYVLHELPPDPNKLLHIHTLAALSSAFSSAVQKIEQLEDIQTVKGGRLPLSGSLKKVLNYMAIQFAQGQYEFLNIAYNMGSGEYELHTPADIERLHNTGKFGDRRLVLTCTIHELRKICQTDQLKLEIPDDSQNNAPTRQDRQLDTPVHTAGLSGSDEPEATRSRDDGSNSGKKSDHLESPLTAD